MPRSLRYHQAKVQDHLASQYVLGTMSPLCRRRTEALAQRIPELEARLYAWQQHMSPIHNHTQEVTPPDRVWQALAQEVGLTQKKPSLLARLWQSALPWRISTGVAFILLAALMFIFPMQPNAPVLQSASYMASLYQPSTVGAPLSGEPQMVLMAYQSSEARPSQLRLQWNQRTTKADIEGLYVWASSREDGQLTLLGVLSDLQKGRDLSKAEWAAIKNSAELLVTNGQNSNDTIRFQGPCVQLNAWGVPGQQSISL